MKKLLTLSSALLFAASLNATAITITFDEGSLPAGTIITNQYAGLGLASVSATGGTGTAALFNSEASTTAEDYDLLRTRNGTTGGANDTVWNGGGNLPNNTILRNLLIVQDNQRTTKNSDGTYMSPDDEVGSAITFMFSTSINSFGFDFVDIEAAESLTVNFFANGISQGIFSAAALSTGEVFGNNSINRTNLKDLIGLGVNKVVFNMSGSGAIDNVRYSVPSHSVPDGGTSLVLLGASLLGLAALRRFRK